MDSRLRTLIGVYQISVARAVKLLFERAGIPMSRSYWELWRIPGTGQLAEGARYWRHGRGYQVTFPDGAVDFDFGDSGEIDGLDLYKLKCFAVRRQELFGFRSGQEIEDAFQTAVDACELIRSGCLW